MLLNEDQAMIQRDRIKQSYPDVHIDIQMHKPAGKIEFTACTLWTWRDGDATSIPLKTEAEVTQWLHKQTKPLLDPELRNTVGKAVYEADGRSQIVTLGGPVIEWHQLSHRQQDIWCKRGEAAIRAFFAAQPVPLEVPHGTE